MTTILVAGATGMLGGSIARHLLDQDDVEVRLLVRPSTQLDPEKAAVLEPLRDRGATVVAGDVGDPASLHEATVGVDVVISALQGGDDVVRDGQIALAKASAANGVRRFFASDFAIDLFAAPDGAPQFDARKQADAEIDAMEMQVVHVLNGAFMDMMVNPAYPGIVDVENRTARIWGTGDERFDLTTVDDTAQFTARLATDPAEVSGVRTISGTQASFNAIVAETEQLTGEKFTVQTLGDADDLRRITAAADDPWSVMMEWYLLAMITVPPLAQRDVDRHPDPRPTTLREYLTTAHAALAA